MKRGSQWAWRRGDASHVFKNVWSEYLTNRQCWIDRNTDRMNMETGSVNLRREAFPSKKLTTKSVMIALHQQQPLHDLGTLQGEILCCTGINYWCPSYTPRSNTARAQHKVYPYCWTFTLLERDWLYQTYRFVLVAISNAMDIHSKKVTACFYRKPQGMWTQEAIKNTYRWIFAEKRGTGTLSPFLCLAFFEKTARRRHCCRSRTT